MRQYLRRFAKPVIALSLGLISTASSAQPAKPAPDGADLVGKWIGEVDATVGAMPIGLTLRIGDDKRVVGNLSTFHGVWPITGVKKTRTGWTLDFKPDEGGEGHMIAVIDDGELKGDWDLRPRTTGKFKLKRVKVQ